MMAVMQEEKNWSESLRKGEDLALSFYFKLHAKSLVFFANRLINNSSEAEDVVADCFVKVWERRADFQTEENIKAFLYISCRNACLDYLRRIKVKTSAQQVYLNQQEEGEDTTLNHIITAEVLTILNEEISQLPENYREVFQLMYFDLKKTDEIADQLGLSVQTVRNYKARAIALLKTSMLKRGISSMGLLALVLFIEGR
jgi:RNA polymerase sigma-70 factor (family 1)